MAKILNWLLNLFKSMQPSEGQQSIQPEATYPPVSNPVSTPQGATVPHNESKVESAVLTRNSDNGVETRGKLIIKKLDGTIFSCDTLELPYKNNQHDISCISQGTYLCSLKPFHNTKMYELSPTAPRTGIFIHSGNEYTDVLGCILLGDSYSDINSDGQLDVINSKNTITAMMSFVDNLSFVLQIVNSPTISVI